MCTINDQHVTYRDERDREHRDSDYRDKDRRDRDHRDKDRKRSDAPVVSKYHNLYNDLIPY